MRRASHRLSSYAVKFPIWQGASHTRYPFVPWASGGSLPWYQAYNAAKHNRQVDFNKANFSNLLESFAGLVAVLSAQFWTEDFSPSAGYLVVGRSSDDFDDAVGGYCRVKFPDDWPDAERYDFAWSILSGDADPFQNYRY